MALFRQIGGIATSSIGNLFKNPLSSLLSGGKGSVLSLKFPEDLGSNASRMHAVQIEIYNVISPNAERKIVSTQTNNSTIFGKIDAIASSVVNSAKNEVKTATENIVKSVEEYTGGVISKYTGIASSAKSTLDSTIESYDALVNASPDNLSGQLSAVSTGLGEAFAKSIEALSKTKDGLETFLKSITSSSLKTTESNFKLVQTAVDMIKSDNKKAINEALEKYKTKIIGNKSIESAKDSGGAVVSDKTIIEKGASLAKDANNLIQNLQLVIQPNISELKGVISLYMPDTLATTYKAEWDSYALKDAEIMGFSVEGMQAGGKAIEEAVTNQNAQEKVKEAWKNGYDNTQGNIMEKVVSGATEIAKALKDEVDTNQNLADFITYGIGKFGNAEMKKAVENYFGRATNEQTSLRFIKNNHRSFALEFDLIPKNQAEADSIVGIINALTYASTMSANGKYTSSSLGYPSIVRLKFMSPSNGVLSSTFSQIAKSITSITGISALNSTLGITTSNENERIFKFGDMVITDVTVDYASNIGKAFFNDGTPVHTKLTIQFTEWALPTRERMEKGEIR